MISGASQSMADFFKQKAAQCHRFGNGTVFHQQVVKQARSLPGLVHQ
jgi:hypothetical protein